MKFWKCECGQVYAPWYPMCIYCTPQEPDEAEPGALSLSTERRETADVEAPASPVAMGFTLPVRDQPQA